MMLKLLNDLQKDMGLLLSLVVLVEDRGMFVFHLVQGNAFFLIFQVERSRQYYSRCAARSSFTSVSGVIGQYAKCQPL
jgi:hypothetical protein